MEKNELRRLISEYGEAVITYRSPNSNKVKYSVCTTNFNNWYIRAKHNRAVETDNTLLTFSWDADGYKLVRLDNILSVRPLASEIRNGRV